MTPAGRRPPAEMILSELERAENELLRGSDSVVLVGDGKILARADGKGLLPLLSVLDQVAGVKVDMALADSIVGLAAAFFTRDYPIRAVYARVISEKAEAYLQEHGVYVKAVTRVPVIMNREGTGMCPLEKIAVESEDRQQAKCRIGEFLQQITR